jgi:hypothetical protein
MLSKFNFNLGGFQNDQKEGEGSWVFSDGSEIKGYFIGDTLSEGEFTS